MTTDYKSSVFLPKTDFPMRAGLAKKEPELLKRWADMDLFHRLRAESRGRPKFVLHDGPPYANGNLHIGHALNKILKDLVTRTQQMLGKDSHYVPGWDCHGLPIEWKIEEEYRAKNQDKDAVPVGEFRRQCRAFADHWIKVQREEFKRLGVEGDWENYYSTMAYESEAVIANELGKFLMNGGLYKGSKAVLWSVVEKTALAEAEIEYHDHTSDTVHVRFPVVKSKGGKLDGASVVIWTTTPWTIPGNRALAFGPDIAYALVEVAEVGEGSRAKAGEKMVLAKELVDAVAETAKFTPKVLGDVAPEDFDGLLAAHPLRGQGYDFDVRLLPGGFVTADAGTGFVHIAPGHGADDYELGVANGVEVPDTVAEDGSYYPHVPLFAGKKVYTAQGVRGDANRAVSDALDKAGKLLAFGRIRHSYPHSWRSKAPVIFRNAPQWFIAMDKPIAEIGGTLREKALAAIDATRFVPRAGYNRLRSMIEQRPDWCVSRQRAWGVPITVFVNKATGEPLRDPEVMGRVVEAFKAEGADVWFESPPERFLGNKYKAEDFEQVTDILDVWFDSGSHARLHARGQSRAEVAGRPLSRRLRPASRLVPFLAAGELRHARPRALRRRADARLHARRAGPQDVEVAGQHHGAAGSVRPVRRRHPAPVGGRHRLHRGPAHRPGDPEAPGRGLSPAAQHLALPAGQPRRLLGGGEGGLCRHARARALGAASPGRARRRVPAGGRRLRLPQDRDRAAQFLRRRSLGLLLRHPQGRDLLRRARCACAGAPRAR